MSVEPIKMREWEDGKGRELEVDDLRVHSSDDHPFRATISQVAEALNSTLAGGQRVRASNHATGEICVGPWWPVLQTMLNGARVGHKIVLEPIDPDVF